MRSKTVLGCLAAVLLLAVSPAAGFAQITGFRVGIAPAPFGFPPVPQAQFGIPPLAFPPAVAPQTPFGGGFFGVSPFVSPFPVVPFGTAIAPTFPTVIIPNQVLLPGQTFVQPPVIVGPPPAVPAVTPPSVILGPPHPGQPGTPLAPQGPPRMPPPGTSRADVIQQMGQPSVTIVTGSGETLFFPGGASVIIRNGQVAGPR
jgi:hypothetical protein